MFRKKESQIKNNKLKSIIENLRKQNQAGKLKIDKNAFSEKEIEIIKDIANKETVSSTYIQRKFSLSYTKTADVIDKLEVNNIISPPIDLKKNRDRVVLINKNNSYSGQNSNKKTLENNKTVKKIRDKEITRKCKNNTTNIV